MGKRLFLLIIAGMMWFSSIPSVLMAADTVEVSGLDNARVVETVPVPEPEPEPELPAAPVAGHAPITVQLANYTVANYSGDIMINPVGIVKTGDLIYGHNSGDLMGSLVYRNVGEVFTITEDGVMREYRVSAMVTYEKTADGYLNGDPYLMGDIVYGAMGHTVALMTCAGQMLGGGDATHRLVVFADAV